MCKPHTSAKPFKRSRIHNQRPVIAINLAIISWMYFAPKLIVTLQALNWSWVRSRTAFQSPSKTIHFDDVTNGSMLRKKSRNLPLILDPLTPMKHRALFFMVTPSTESLITGSKKTKRTHRIRACILPARWPIWKRFWFWFWFGSFV